MENEAASSLGDALVEWHGFSMENLTIALATLEHLHLEGIGRAGDSHAHSSLPSW